MNKILSISLLACTALIVAGCSSNTATTPTAVVDADPLLTSHTAFVSAFADCRNDLNNCDLDRDMEIS